MKVTIEIPFRGYCHGVVEIPTEDYESLMDDPLRYCSEKDILDKLEGFIEEYDSDKIYAGKVIERGE